MNKIFLIGKVYETPEVKLFKSGDSVMILKLLTHEKILNKDYYNWHRIVLYKNLKNFSKFSFEKGDLLFVEGKMNTRNWTDKNQNTRYITEIVAKEIKILKKYKGDKINKLNEFINEENNNYIENNDDFTDKIDQNENYLQKDIINELETLNSIDKEDYFKDSTNFKNSNDSIKKINNIEMLDDAEINLMETNYELEDEYN